MDHFLRRMRSRIFCALSAVALSAMGDNMLKNGDFEKGFDFWRKPGTMWRVEDGAGYGGTKGLVWENKDCKKREYPAQYVKLEPGCAYRLTALVKVDELQKGVGPSIGFEWFDVNRKWVAGSYAHPVDDNGILKDGWVRYEATTRMMKETDARGGVLCMLKAGATGKVRFDDFTFESVPVKPIEFLCTSAYRDSAADGTLRILASVNADTNKLTVALSVRTAFGSERVLSPVFFSDDVAVFTIPVADLAMGSQKMKFVLASRDNGKGIAAEKVEFTRLPESNPQKRRVSFDSQCRMILDGKRFFPLGHYTGYMSPDDIKQYKRGPYNFAVQYAGINERQLDEWQRAGVFVAAYMRGYLYGYPYATKRGWKTFEDTKIQLKDRFKAIGHHPALIMWYLNDEAPVSMVRNTVQVHEFLHSLDPERATLSCLCNPETARDFLPSYDVLAHDCYPIGNHAGPRSELERITRQMRVAADNMRLMRPLWFIPQTFDWKWCYSKEVWPKCEKKHLRMPTRQEMANMTWQGIACGANGIIFYSYSTIRKNTKGDEFEKAWGDTCDVAFEIKKMEDVLLSDDVTEEFAAGCKTLSRYLPVRFYRRDGKIWMLAVNATREAMKSRIDMPSSCRDLVTALGVGASLAPDGKSIFLDLPPMAYAFVSFFK